MRIHHNRNDRTPRVMELWTFLLNLSLILTLGLGIVGADEESKNQVEEDPPLLKNYPENVVAWAKGNFSQILDLRVIPENTRTSDNVSLAIMHVIDTKEQKESRDTREPILLMHGLMGTSDMWLLNANSSDLVIQLHGANYDVWLGNDRGSYRSVELNHVSTTTPGPYWNFSFHELGLFDLPAMIDHILEATQRKTLRLACHSQGCSAFLVMASLKTDYAQKLYLVHAITPAAYFDHAKTPAAAFVKGMHFFRDASPFQIDISKFPMHGMTDRLIKKFEFPFNYPVVINFHKFCLQSKMNLEKCLRFYHWSFGASPDQLNQTLVPIYLYHYPKMCSLRENLHYLQIYKTGRFAPLDETFLSSGHASSSASNEYPLNVIKTPVALHYCKNDLLMGVEDIQHLAERLPNVVENSPIPVDSCNHVDPVLGIDVGRILFERFMQIEKKLTFRRG